MQRDKPLRDHVGETARLAGPLAAAQLATFMMGMVDVACVGRYSEQALGAVAIGTALHWAFSCLMLGVPLALDPLISQAIGRGNAVRAHEWLRRGVELVLLLGVPLVAVEVVSSRYLSLLGIPNELAMTVHEYVRVCAPSMVFFQLFLVGRAYLQSVQITRPILFATVLTNLVNLVSDICLVFGDDAFRSIGLPPIGLPALGVVGAGITTTVSAATLSAIIWRAVQREMKRREHLANTPEGRSPSNASDRRSPASRQQVLSLAWPIGCQQVAESWLFCLFGVLVGRFGEIAAAGYQAALTLAAGAFMLALGLASATSVRVGHAVGQGSRRDMARAGIAGNILVVCVMGLTATVFVLIPHPLVSLLTDKENVIEVAVPLLSYAAAFALFDGVQAVMAGALRGAGDVRIPFILGFFSYWGVGGVVGFYGMTYHGVPGIWLGLTAGLVTASLLLSARWYVVSQREIGAVG